MPCNMDATPLAICDDRHVIRTPSLVIRSPADAIPGKTGRVCQDTPRAARSNVDGYALRPTGPTSTPLTCR
jgi:hypothetical protein